MKRRIWTSLAMLLAGTSLLVESNLASAGGPAARLKEGGIFRLAVGVNTPSIDPQRGYDPFAWSLSYATGAKLYNYPDKAGAAGMKLVPEVASSLAVSKNGKRYTFTLRKGFRFSDGARLTAENFKYAITRVANHDLISAGATFITDPSGTDIVGARAAMEGKTNEVSGVVANGDRLIINLTRPDPTFMAKITMPFFQATSMKVPLDKPVVEVASITDMPSPGPYAFSRNDVGTLTMIRKNPYWKPGPGRRRPRRLDGVRIQWNVEPQTAFNQLMANDLDLVGSVPPAQIPGLVERYGVNKTRLWVEPLDCTGWLVPNTSRPLFKKANMRKALNYAVDRKAYISVLGPYAGRPWSQILNPGVPGWRNVQPYPLQAPNLAKAKNLAGPLNDTKINVWYVASQSYFPGSRDQFQIVRRDLIRLGFKPENIVEKPFTGLGIFKAMSIKGNDADLGVSMGWCSDYPDPYDWININFYGKSIRDEGNLNMSYFNSPKWNRRMERAARLTGAARLRAYGRLDIDLMKQAAPVVPMETLKSVSLFSKRVDPRSLVYQRIYDTWSIPALALK